MKMLRNEKGFALLFVLILSAIALVMTLGMLFMVGRGSFVSGQQKRYRTAVEASRGGAEAMLQLIANGGTSDPTYMVPVDAINLKKKITDATDSWGTLDKSIVIDPLTASTYDMKVVFVNYTAYTKIVDTVKGNSAAGEVLLKPGVVNTGSGEVAVQSIPYLYTIEVLSQSTANPSERSKLSVLYQY